ncbi:MAG: insulinase family protein [Candidatus Omnitrophica bacterium]|nr:insulinase family protein [Candidatus Omnitrophota bacterium]
MYRFEKLPHGLSVVTSEMPGKDSIAAGIWVKVGGRYETAKYAGISHFVEHMLFKGTKNRDTRAIKEDIEGIGGVLNAFTAEELTCYFAKVLKNHLHLALDVLSDMVRNPLFLETEIEKERTVIVEEIKMYQDVPAHYVHDLIGSLMWPKEPLGFLLTGDEASVSRIRRNHLVNFVNQYYRPINVLVAVCGDVEHKEVMNTVERYFPAEAKVDESEFKPVVVKQIKPRVKIVDKQTEQTHFVIGMHGFSRVHPHKYRAALLNIIMGANMSSRLFEEVREKRGLAYEISSRNSFLQDTGSFTISAGVETKKAPLALRVILRELDKIRKKPVSDDELRRAKDYFLGQFYMGLEDTLDQMSWLGERALYLKDTPDPFQIRREIEKVSPEDITKTARDIFKNEHLNLALIGNLQDKVKQQIEDKFALD